MKFPEQANLQRREVDQCLPRTGLFKGKLRLTAGGCVVSFGGDENVYN